MTVKNCTLSYIGGSRGGGGERAGNGIQIWHNASYITIDSNTISQVYDAAITNQTDTSDADTDQNHIVISNNILDYNSGGYEFFCHATGSPSVSDISVYGNTITNTGTGWSGADTSLHGNAFSIYNDSQVTISNFNIYQNTVDGIANSAGATYGVGIWIGGGPYNIYQNRINDVAGYGIYGQDRATGCDFQGSIYCNVIDTTGREIVRINSTTSGLTIYNNTFYSPADIWGLAIADNSSSITVKNNIFYVDGATKGLFTVAAGSSMTADNNCLYNAQGFRTIWQGDTDTTIADYRTTSGQDANSIDSNPLMIDPANGNFRLNPHSLCVNAGTAVGLLIDYLGLMIRHAPDIGAHENQANAIF